MLLGRYKKLTWDWILNGNHQVLAYADDVNLIGDDIREQVDIKPAVG